MGFSAMTDAQPRDLLDKAALLLMRLQVAPPGVLCTCGTGPHPIPSALGCVSVDRPATSAHIIPSGLGGADIAAGSHSVLGVHGKEPVSDLLELIHCCPLRSPWVRTP